LSFSFQVAEFNIIFSYFITHLKMHNILCIT